jgi:spore germination cell wall hydrolase CwlJ-like protein
MRLMIASLARRAPLAARSALGAAMLLAGTNPVAYQDLASLLVNQPGVAERARTFLLSNPLSSLRTATFSLPGRSRLAIPRLPLPDHFAIINASLPRASRAEPLDLGPAAPHLPAVNRGSKRDRLVPSPKETIHTLGPSRVDRGQIQTAGTEIADDAWLAVVESEPFGHNAEFAGILARDIDPVPPSGSVLRLTHLLFGKDEIELPRLSFEHVLPSPVERLRLAALPGSTIDDSTSVATKGIVTGDDATPKSPAERLQLSGLNRAKAEKCLADAIYFESRGEVERGQIAVAQVVINRVFSGYYPEDICGTVYQNAHRHLACQFTFACEGKKLIVNDQVSWARATRISRDMLDGKLWLNDVGKATHYHANWVKPRWVSEMRTIQRIGVHTFYRPRKWEVEG